MERFLRYSLEKQRPIRLIFFADDGSMKQLNAQVTNLQPGQVTFTSLRPKGTYDIPLERLLSADYKRGDEGQD